MRTMTDLLALDDDKFMDAIICLLEAGADPLDDTSDQPYNMAANDEHSETSSYQTPA